MHAEEWQLRDEGKRRLLHQSVPLLYNTSLGSLDDLLQC